MSTIVAYINENGYEYDIHSLIKAFYPEVDVKVKVDETLLGNSDVKSGEVEYNESLKREESSDEDYPDILILKDGDTFYMFLSSHDFYEGKKVSVLGMDKPVMKNTLKRLIYTVLSDFTKKTLPWGTLTGIRPSKIARTLLEEGSTDSEIDDYLSTVYMCSKEKRELSLDIAKRERRLLSNLHYKDGYSLYIGIPFCPTTCLYCSFTSYPIASWKKRVEEYLQALFLELEFVASSFKDKILDTVYIGGGTPTTLEPEEMDRLLSKIEECFDLSSISEFTVEGGRADSISLDKLKVLKKHNVSRISVNPQTMNQKTLDFIGRRHTVEDVERAFADARNAGLDNINMDIILGLPGEDEEEVLHTIEEIKKLDPDSLTVHSLAIKRASRLSEWIKQNGLTALNNTDATMEIARKGALDMGMNPYYLYRQKNMSGNFENVGYAKEGKEGIYNILIMEEVQTIIACGAGTVTKRVYLDGRIERCDNVKDVALYIEKIDEMIERKRDLFSN